MLKYKEPTFVRLPKNKLKVNTDFYQKQYVPRNVQKLVKVWDDNAVGTLTVVHDKNGEYWVVDGQHRLLAAKKLPHVKTMPCMVHDSDDVNEDARLYIKINTTHKKPDAKHLFKLSYELRDEPAYTLGTILDDYGFIWRSSSAHGKSKPVVSCVKTLERVYNDYGLDITRNAIRIMGMVHSNETIPSVMSGDVLLGLSYLLSKYNIPDNDKFTEAISKCTPGFLKACCDDAVRSCPFCNKDRPRSVLAQGVANAVNSNMKGRNKTNTMVYENSSIGATA